MAQSMPAYRCVLLDRAGVPTAAIRLALKTDREAILAGITLAQETPACRGFEIRNGPHLVYAKLGSAEGRRPPADDQMIGLPPVTATVAPET